MKKVVFILALICFSFNNVKAQTKAERKQEKIALKIKKYEKIKNLVHSRNFLFTADFVKPQRGARINLITNLNFLKIEEDITNIFMPYFGVVNTAVSQYNGPANIDIEDISIKKYAIDFNDEKQKITIKSILLYGEQIKLKLLFLVIVEIV